MRSHGLARRRLLSRRFGRDGLGGQRGSQSATSDFAVCRARVTHEQAAPRRQLVGVPTEASESESTPGADLLVERATTSLEIAVKPTKRGSRVPSVELHSREDRTGNAGLTTRREAVHKPPVQSLRIAATIKLRLPSSLEA